MAPGVLIIVIIFGLYLLSSIKILPEYERGVIFRLGRLLSEPKGPGIFLVFAPIDRMVRISLRQEGFEGAAPDLDRARRDLPARPFAPRAERAGHLSRLRADRPHGAHLAAAGGVRSAAAGH